MPKFLFSRVTVGGDAGLSSARRSATWPRPAVLGLLALWLLLWLTWTAWTTQSPPVDNAEQLSWVRSLQWGYYKHPPLPTAVLWPLVQLFGVQEWVSYAAAGLVNLASLCLLYRLLNAVTGARQALLALLGTLCVGYYSLRLAYFNHDTLLMLAHLAAAWFTWQAFAQRSRHAWWGLGLALGLGGLAKYQVVLSAGAVLVFWGLRRGWRDPLHRRGVAEAAALSLLVVSPHLVWLVDHGFQPFEYARQNALDGRLTRAQCSVDALRWIGDQLVQLAGPLLLGAVLQWLGRRAAVPWTSLFRPSPWEALAGRRAGPARVDARPGAVDVPGAGVQPREAARAFLLCFGLLPLLWMPAMAVVLGAKLHMNWGTAFMPLTCAALMQLIGTRRWHALPLRQVLAGFAAIQCVLAAWAWQQHAVPRPVYSQHRSAQFDSRLVAEAIAAPAHELLGGPVRVIAGRQRLVSVLALRLPERPLVLVDGRPELSPWLPDDLSALCAVLWVGDAGDRPPADVEVHALPQGLWWAVEVLSERADLCPATRAAGARARGESARAQTLDDLLAGMGD